MPIVTVPGGIGVTIAIPFSSDANAASAQALLADLYDAPAPSRHVADASTGLMNDAAILGDVNEFVDNVSGQIAVPAGYQYLIGDYVTGTSPYPTGSFVAAGVLDGAVLDMEPSTLAYTAGTGLVTVIAGGNLTINTRASGGGNGVLLLDGAGSETANLASGSWSVTTGTGSGSFTLGTGADTINVEGQDTIHGGGGPAQVVLDHGLDVFDGGAGTTTVVDHGYADTIVGGTGRETVFAQGSGLHVQGNGAEVLFIDSNGGNTVIANTSGIVAFGGANGSTYQTANNYFFFTSGGGSDTIKAAAGAQGPVVFGSPNGRIQIDAAAQGTFVVAGGGNETINASASSGGVIFFSGTGNAKLMGGSGANFYAASTGDSTMQGGVGNVYEFIDGHESGTNTITDFTPYDQLFLADFGTGANDGIKTEIVTNGTLNMTLADGTLIKFDNISNASELDGKIFHI